MSDAGLSVAGKNIPMLFSRSVIFALAIILSACSFVQVEEGGRSGDGKVYFYSANSIMQLTRQPWALHADIEGCHSLKINRPAHRFAQSGFDYCQVFSGKQCEPDTVLTALWGGNSYRVVEIDVDEPQPKLYRGNQWVLNPEGNVSVGSWACYYPE